MRKMEGKDEKEGKEEGGAAHSIDSRAIRAIVRESAGRGGARHH